MDSTLHVVFTYKESHAVRSTKTVKAQARLISVVGKFSQYVINTVMATRYKSDLGIIPRSIPQGMAVSYIDGVVIYGRDATGTLITRDSGGSAYKIKLPDSQASDGNVLKYNSGLEQMIWADPFVTDTITEETPGSGVCIEPVLKADVIDSCAGAGISFSDEAISDFVATTKGDLITSANGTLLTRLGVGTDRQILKANSGLANGIGWSDTIAVATLWGDAVPDVTVNASLVYPGALVIDGPPVQFTSGEVIITTAFTTFNNHATNPLTTWGVLRLTGGATFDFMVKGTSSKDTYTFFHRSEYAVVTPGTYTTAFYLFAEGADVRILNSAAIVDGFSMPNTPCYCEIIEFL
jgi:hypothetical protein